MNSFLLVVVCMLIILGAFLFCIFYAVRCFVRYGKLQRTYQKLQDGLLNSLSQDDLEQICDKGTAHTIYDYTRTLHQQGFDAGLHRKRWERFLRYGLGTDFKITSRAINHQEFQYQLCVFWERVVYEHAESSFQTGNCSFVRNYREAMRDDLKYLWKHSSAETQDKFRGKLHTHITRET